MKLCLPNLKQFDSPDIEIQRFEYEAKNTRLPSRIELDSQVTECLRDSAVNR